MSAVANTQDDEHPPPVPASAVPAEPAGPAFDELFVQRWGATVQLALLLVDDEPSAEDVAQEAFTGLLRHWHQLGDLSRAQSYLNRAVVNGARSALRRRRTARAWTPPHATPDPSAEELALLGDERREVFAAVAALPLRQREVVVLRYWSQLDEAATAEAMGITRGTVKSTAHKAMAALHRRLGGPSTSAGGLR
ncbi:sigma-70 family RNA polymerase sigma factor [Quadrisphaera sp. INWT6]|uniref:sigma-70 family RNA polymerase sigma factor n=1 Tax=Quadrisphaera sp. INWT6 TaxID=2596917 RepID=UPI00189211E4|nr:sigma-70 family RNA polymerase sigma factor [Quadrisphaera sp. INWT6]MBF5082689.1 sigma-70 family RNA polymerase sigma factor [Quadrisphaera sp. INWT6]